MHLVVDLAGRAGSYRLRRGESSVYGVHLPAGIHARHTCAACECKVLASMFVACGIAIKAYLQNVDKCRIPIHY